MRAVPPQADPFPHPHKVRSSHVGVYRRSYSPSLGQKTHMTAHQFERTTGLSDFPAKVMRRG